MSTDYKREYLLRLPLPLAQLYSAANNARQPLVRASNAFYVFEVMVRLAGAALVGCYRNEISLGLSRESGIDRVLGHLEQPSHTDWMLIVSALAKHFGTRPDAATHPMGHLQDQLSGTRTDLPGLLALYRAVESELGEEPMPDDTFSVRRILEAVMRLRQAKAGQDETLQTVSDTSTDELLIPAINEILDEGCLDVLGPAGSTLIWMEDVRTLDSNQVEISGQALIGSHGERLDDITVPADQADSLLPERVAIVWPNRNAPLPVDPLLHYQEGDLNVDVVFFHKAKNAHELEYFVYSASDTTGHRDIAPSFAEMMSDITGEEASQAAMGTMQDFVDDQPVTGDLLPHQIRLRLLEPQGGDAPSQWVFTTDDEISIGREQGNNVLLLNPRVSRKHGQMNFDGSNWQYKNLGSNGTLRAGEKVEEFSVQNRDVIQLAGSGPRVQFDLCEM